VKHPLKQGGIVERRVTAQVMQRSMNLSEVVVPFCLFFQLAYVLAATGVIRPHYILVATFSLRLQLGFYPASATSAA
jgi:hypothetical protein